MKAVSHQYLLPDNLDPAGFLDQLELPGQLRVSPVVYVTRTCYDTFDWRLRANHSCLVEEQQAGSLHTRWLRLDDATLLAKLNSGVPRFVADLPPSSLRTGLAPLVEMRVLLPVVQLQVRAMPARLVDKQGKTVLRLVIDQARVGPPGAPCTQVLPARVCLNPVRGYCKPLLLAVKQLQEVLGLAPTGPLIDTALQTIGRPPEDYSGKLNLSLQAEMPAGEAARIILQALLRTMLQNLEGVCADLDSEFLHDFRVAVRRTRSLFSQFKGVLPPQVLKVFRPGFRWLGQITGPTRDLDVYLLKFPAYRQSLETDMQAELQPLHDFLVRHQRQEQRKLAGLLRSARCRQLLQDWQSFLETPMDEATWPGPATSPIGALASRKIWKAYCKVLQVGDALAADSDAAALHALRIDCKKLRYLMEFFASIYPGKEVRRQIKELKALQDHLGDFQDLEVQANALRDFGHAMQAEQPDLPGDVFMAMGVLIDSLYKRQSIERQNFSGRFARFARPGNRKICHGMFKPSPSDKDVR